MHSKPVHHGKGIALAFISMALGALITIWYKPMMEQGMPAISIALIESCVMVLILLIAKPWRVLRSNKRIQYPILICSVCQAVGGISYFFGLSYLDPVTFSFLTRNQAIFSVLFGFFFLSERHNIVTWLFIVLAVIGSLTLCYADINSMNLAGIVYAVLFCLSFGVRNFILRKHPRTPALVNIFYGYLLTIVFLLLMACFSSAYKFHSVEMFDLSKIVAISIFASFGTLYFLQISLRYAPVSVISPIRLFSPYMVAVYFGWQIGFNFSTTKTLGMVIMTLAIFTLIYNSRVQYVAATMQKSI